MPAEDPPARNSYHHGDLRRTVLEGALAEIDAHGPAAISLRSIAKRAGVSHSAPQHHFGDKRGLLSAIAADGYGLLADATATAWEQRHQVLDVGMAYVGFAISHRAHFEVMFRPELYREDDVAVTAARDRAAATLFETVQAGLGPGGDEDVWGGVVGVWSFVHGFSTLWLNGNFYAEVGTNPAAAAQSAIKALRALIAAGALEGDT
jgi:AcrR family transcriptional regulator